MTFEPSRPYTIQDKDQENVIELQSVKPLENWYKATIKSQKLSPTLQDQFDQIESHVKAHDFKSVQKLESEIISKNLSIKELDQVLSEIQIGKKNTIFFKIAE